MMGSREPRGANPDTGLGCGHSLRLVSLKHVGLMLQDLHNDMRRRVAGVRLRIYVAMREDHNFTSRYLRVALRSSSRQLVHLINILIGARTKPRIPK